MGQRRQAKRAGRKTLLLNVKDPVAHSLARTLAKETGETITQAVTEAIRERFERVRRGRKRDAVAAELLAIGRRCARTLKRKPVDHGRLVYSAPPVPASGAESSPFVWPIAEFPRPQ